MASSNAAFSNGKFRALLIGLGGRSRGHAEGLLKSEGIEFAAACDIDAERRARYEKDFGVRTYADAAEALQKESPDIAIVCTREKPRYALAKLAVEHGVRAVVLEKPMAANIREARDLVKQCEERGVLLTVMHQMRFSDEFVAAKEAIASGAIGTPYYVRAVSYGHLMEQGPHMIDMILYLLGEPKAQWVMGQVADREEGLTTVHPAPAFVTGYIAFENGVRASVECGRRFPSAVGVFEDDAKAPTWLQKRVQVIGTDGICDAMVAHYCRVMNGSGGWKTLTSGPDGWNAATIRHYQEVVKVLREGGEHRNGAAPSLAGFEIIHGIYTSALVGDVVNVPVVGGNEEPIESLLAPARKAQQTA